MKPTLGHPSRIAAIRALRIQGCTERQIADRLGIKPNTVTSLESRAKKRGSLCRGRPVRITISGEAYGDLLEEAGRRKITPKRLASNLVQIVARDDLFNALLEE